MKLINQQFLDLVRTGVWGTKPDAILFNPYITDWQMIGKMSRQHNVTAIIAEGIKHLSPDLQPPKEIVDRNVIYQTRVKNRNEHVDRIMVEVYKEFEKANIPVGIMKGQVTASYYPNPNLRESGDVDMVISNANRARVLKLFNEIGAAPMEKYNENRDEFLYKEVMFEIHRKMHNFHNNNNNATFEALFNSAFPISLCEVPILVDGQPNVVTGFPLEMNITFQVAHIVHHQFCGGCSCRQLLDLAMTLHKNAQIIQWESLIKYLNLLNMERAFNVFIYILSEHLGLDRSFIPVTFHSLAIELGEQTLHDILRHGNNHIGYKYKRCTSLGRFYRRGCQILRAIEFYKLCPVESTSWIIKG